MYAKLLDIDRFVEVNKLKEITNPIALEHGSFTPDGLFSTEIFGISQYDRSTIWAYIDLGERFLHPLAAINFRRYSNKYENIIHGYKNYRFVDGEPVEDPDGETGIQFLYDHYDEIRWKETDSIFSKERIKFLSQGKDKIFITKFPVTPAFYRDVNEKSNIGIPEVNEYYTKLISQSIALKKKSGSFSFFGNMTRSIIQKTLVDIFMHYIKGEFSGKYGIMRRNVMGVDVDYGTWLVMSAPVIKGKRYTDMPIRFDRTGIPLAALCSLGGEFVVKGVKDFFDNEFARGGKYPYMDRDGTIKYLDLIDPENEYSEETIRKAIASFINGHSTRFEAIKIPRNRQGLDLYLYISGRFGKNTMSVREYTWTDVLYLTCHRLLRNKHIMITRYPVESLSSVYYSKIHILSTTTTVHAEIDGEVYEYYPVVYPNQDSSNMFINTLTPNNTMLAALGGDYDGDSVPNRLIFTDEGNLDAERYIRDKKNFISLIGKNIRPTERDFVQAIYSLTKDPKVIKLEDLN